jgi:hypothetical protein
VKDSTLPSNLTIRTLCADENATFIKGSTGTTKQIEYAYPLELTKGTAADTMTWQNVRVVYLSNGSNGDGSYTNPFTSISSACNDVENNGGYIAVIGTVSILNHSHDRDVLIKRGANFNGTMINVNAGGANARLNDMVIDGGGVGTVFSCGSNDSSLYLDNNIILVNCYTAINAANGNVSINSAYISASQYSVYMGANSGTLTLTPPSSGPQTQIIGAIYLANGKYITVGSYLNYMAGYVSVVSENMESGTLIASCGEVGIANQSISKISLIGGSVRRLRANIIIV